MFMTRMYFRAWTFMLVRLMKKSMAFFSCSSTFEPFLCFQDWEITWVVCASPGCQWPKTMDLWHVWPTRSSVPLPKNIQTSAWSLLGCIDLRLYLFFFRIPKKNTSSVTKNCVFSPFTLLTLLLMVQKSQRTTWDFFMNHCKKRKKPGYITSWYGEISPRNLPGVLCHLRRLAVWDFFAPFSGGHDSSSSSSVDAVLLLDRL